MAKVYECEFAKNLEKRREVERRNKETQDQITYFMKYFGDQPREVLNKIWVTMNTGDLEEFKRLSEPIIMKKLMKEYNVSN